MAWLTFVSRVLIFYTFSVLKSNISYHTTILKNYKKNNYNVIAMHPESVVCLRESFYICIGNRIDCRHIESVFAVLLRESDSFQCDGITNSTHLLYMYVGLYQTVYMPHFYTGVGHCIVYYRTVLSEPS